MLGVHGSDGLNDRGCVVDWSSVGVGQGSCVAVAVAVAHCGSRVGDRSVGSMGVGQRSDRRMAVAVGSWGAKVSGGDGSEEQGQNALNTKT